MLAAVYDKDNPAKLVLQEVDKPIPGEKEVLIKIHSVSINAADYRCIKMHLIPKNKIFGADISGVVEEVGSGNTKFKVGDEVVGDSFAHGFGGFAEYVAVPEDILARKPRQISHDTAAAIPMASTTALHALRNYGNIQPGQRVLICGASGGVGLFALQLARYFGAEVTALCSGRNTELVQKLGANHVIDYQTQYFLEKGKQYELILAVNGKYPMSDYRKALAPGGKLVVIGGPLSQILKVAILRPVLSIGNKKFMLQSSDPNTKDLETILELVTEDRIKVIIDRTYPLSEAAEALSYISRGHAGGKVILRVVNP